MLCSAPGTGPQVLGARGADDHAGGRGHPARSSRRGQIRGPVRLGPWLRV